MTPLEELRQVDAALTSLEAAGYSGADMCNDILARRYAAARDTLFVMIKRHAEAHRILARLAARI